MSELTLGTLVRFGHEQNGGPVHCVVSVMQDGMIELHDMGGYFAPHLFVVADDIGDIPAPHAHDDLLPCPFCGADAERIDVPVEDEENAGGSCIQCTRCIASTALHFDRKEHLYSSWNERVVETETGLTLDGKAIALFRAWADRIPDYAEAFEAWEGMSMADQGEWRRRVIEYEAMINGDAS